MMNILFIYSLQKPVCVNKPLLGQESIQFGVSYISSILKQKGHTTKLAVVSQKYRERSTRMLYRLIGDFNPDLICFTSVYSEIEFISGVAANIKQHFPDVLLMLGGVHITLNPSDEYLRIFNSICIGEGEYPVLEYVQSLVNNTSAKEINNLWIQEEGEIYRNVTREFIADLDSLPFPDRDIWQPWILEPRSRLTVLLGRGCPYHCAYCCNHSLRHIAEGAYVRFRSPENIVAELEYLHAHFPDVKEYFLEVETISVNMTWLTKLCSHLEVFNVGRGLRFGTNVRLYPEMDIASVFRKLQSAGFSSVIIGLESGNERIRTNILKRRYTNEQMKEAVDTARRCGIEVGIFNMIGLPTETRREFMDTMKINQIVQPDWHATSIFFPYKGTELYQMAEKMNILPEKLITYNERQKAVLDLPGFTKKEIQRCFDSFHYDVYKVKENKSAMKLFIYFIMKYIGHNTMANLKLSVLRVLYLVRLHKLAQKAGLLGIFQKS